MHMDSIENINAIIFSGGNIIDYSFLTPVISEYNLVICADGGVRHAARLGIIPDAIVGDMDSSPEELIEHFKQRGTVIKTYPANKDKTDTELAVDYALRSGAKKICITGFSGSRIDHTLANIYLLKYILDHDAQGLLIDPHNEILLIKKSVILSNSNNFRISLLPLTPLVTGLTIDGVAYPLHDAALKSGSTLGISNEFTAEQAYVSLKTGLLLVIKSSDSL